MSTQPTLSPLEQLRQDVQPSASSQSPSQPQSNLSPLEQLGQDVKQPPSQPVDTTHTERAMQQTMGGPPMFVDVPSGSKDQFEKAGQEGYQKGGQIGAGLVAGSTSLAAAAPLITTLAEHLPTLDKAYKILTAIGAGSYTVQHLKDVMKIIGGSSK